MDLNEHLTDLFNSLNKNLDRTIKKAQKSDGNLTLHLGGINSPKERLTTIFGLNTKFIKGCTSRDIAQNESFQQFKEKLEDRGYKLKLNEVADPLPVPKHLNLTSGGLIGLGYWLLLASKPFVKMSGSAMLLTGAGLAFLKTSNITKAKIKLNISPENNI